MSDIFGKSFRELLKTNPMGAGRILKEVEIIRKRGLCDISECMNRAIRNDNIEIPKTYGAFLCPKHHKIYYPD
jgi:hypothetical protein